jgi:hypothetical protein
MQHRNFKIPLHIIDSPLRRQMSLACQERCDVHWFYTTKSSCESSALRILQYGEDVAAAGRCLGAIGHVDDRVYRGGIARA